MPCPDPAALADYRAGTLPPAGAEALEAHAALCPPCRTLLRHLAVLDETAPVPVSPAVLRRLKALRPDGRTMPWRAAAAALLLAAPVLWLAAGRGGAAGRPPHAASPRPAVGRVAPEGFPPGALGRLDASQAFLGRGAELVLAPGARVASLGERRLDLESGSLWLEIARGGPARLEIAGSTLILPGGAVAARIPGALQARRGGLLREAMADEPAEAVLWILRGDAELQAAGRVIPVAAGTRIALPGGARTPIPPGERERLRRDRLEALLSLPARDLLAPGLRLEGPRTAAVGEGGAPAVYRWVTAIAWREPSTEMELMLPAGGAWYRWVVGLAATPPAGEETLEVVWDGERLTCRVGGETVLSATDRSGLERLGPGSAQGTWRISAWGGGARIRRCLLQEEP